MIQTYISTCERRKGVLFGVDPREGLPSQAHKVTLCSLEWAEKSIFFTSYTCIIP